MLLEINFSSEIPIYEQIRREIVKALASGDLQFGEKLPSVRQLAADLGVNLHTVNKAYKLLQADGLIEMDRRSGSKLVDQRPNLQAEMKEDIKEELAYLLAWTKITGTNIHDLIDNLDKEE